MGHGFRGAVTAWLALIVLQTVSTQGGSGRVASLFTDIDGLVKRALDPNIPAIPDRGHPGAPVTPTTPYTPAPLAGPYTPQPGGVAGGLHSRPT